MTKTQFYNITEWQDATFKKANPLSKIAHLAEELQELVHELKSGRKNEEAVKLEFADCFILLFGAAHSEGLEYVDILAAIDTKMKINRSRKWGEPNSNGVVNHVADEG